MKRWRSPKPISISAAAPCWSGAARAAVARGWHGRLGVGGTPALARAPPRAVRGSALLRDQRADARPGVVERRGTSASAQDRRARGRPAALRASPAPAHPCRGARARGRAADRDPAPTGPQQSRHHVRVPAGHRQRRDHRDRLRPPPADDPSQHIPTAPTRAVLVARSSTQSATAPAIPTSTSLCGPDATTSHWPIHSDRPSAAGRRYRIGSTSLRATIPTAGTTSFENIATVIAPEPAYTVEIERIRTRVGGSDALTPLAIRATTVFRRRMATGR
jgi:hypothetical protein